MAKVEIYTKSWCPYSIRAKADLADKGVVFDEINVTSDPEREQEMIVRANRRTVPQIFIDDHHVGGSDELRDANADGSLDRLLSGNDHHTAA